MGNFVPIQTDDYNPEFGGIVWKRRLNQRLEERDVELTPLGYQEGEKPVMPVNQDNTIIYINQVADEMDCIAVQYTEDEGGVYTWYWREVVEAGEHTFEQVASYIGNWAMMITTLYPLEHIVEQYEKMHTRDIVDTIPDDWI
jgi:hypothetical protein